MAKLDSQLWMPPKKALKRPSALKDSPWSDEATRASLSAFMGSVGT